MIAYLDSSVVLRIVLGEEDQLAQWSEITVGVSSRLVIVECHRSLDRMWQQGRLSEETLTLKNTDAHEILGRLELQPLDDSVLDMAAHPFPAPLGTLDGLHLATAIAFRDRLPLDRPPILFATHDLQLARAARAMNFDVIGAPA